MTVTSKLRKIEGIASQSFSVFLVKDKRDLIKWGKIPSKSTKCQELGHREGQATRSA